MTGTGGGANPGGRSGRRWDVALSFAGAERDYVGQVAEVLKQGGVRCFYDADETVRLWGTNLTEELPQIFARESAAVVVFISADYAGGDWTRLERRAAFSRAVTEAGVYVLPARFDDSELPGLLDDVVTVDLRRYTPGQFAELVMKKLADLAISPPLPGGPVRAPRVGMPVSEVGPRLLGVHAAIQVPGAVGELPAYVARKADVLLRDALAAGAVHGCFVLLVGGSSVGKTRLLFEAVRGQLGDWWLVQPADGKEVEAFAASPSPRTVVWLDELERYLSGERAVSPASVRRLLRAHKPMVIAGTLWPESYRLYSALRPRDKNQHAAERELLSLAQVIDVADSLDAEEQARARSLAAADPRIRVALDSADFGFTQVLAAAPELVRCWEHAADPYGKAVITAAIDARRLGLESALSRRLLHSAARGYLTESQQATASADWLDGALSYATTPLRGAATALSPVAAGMGQVAGYRVADYLLQYGSRARRTARLPTSAWEAFTEHHDDAGDLKRLVAGMFNRGLYRHAEAAYRKLAATGDKHAAGQLAELLAKQGRFDDAGIALQLPGGAGDRDADNKFNELLARHSERFSP